MNSTNEVDILKRLIPDGVQRLSIEISAEYLV